MMSESWVIEQGVYVNQVLYHVPLRLGGKRVDSLSS